MTQNTFFLNSEVVERSLPVGSEWATAENSSGIWDCTETFTEIYHKQCGLLEIKLNTQVWVTLPVFKESITKIEKLITKVKELMYLRMFKVEDHFWLQKNSTNNTETS